MAQTKFDIIASKMINIIIICGCLAGAYILVWEMIKWLELGYWPNLILADGLEFFGADLTVAYYPTKMFGLFKIIRWFLAWPLWLCVPLAVFIVFSIIKGIVTFEDNQ
jgi:hypothetical protein